MVDNSLQDAKTNPFAAIWQRFPERQRWGSSTWWYFILAPKQGGGYGPKQAMFSFFSLDGEHFWLNGRTHPGLSQQHHQNGSTAAFNTTALGWIFDGQQLHEDIVHHTCQGIMRPGSFESWTKAEGEGRGGEMCAQSDRPFSIAVTFAGERGRAQFTVWGEPDHKLTLPIMHDHSSLFGGYNIVAWRHLYFAGEFVAPSGREQWEGVGYFQRVCLNVPLFPWKWIWVTFADESSFSCLLPYLGAHLLRRKDSFYPDFWENLAIPLRQGGYFCDGRSGKISHFERVKMTHMANGRQPRFLVECQAKKGDFIRFVTNPYGHVQLLLDRPHLKGRWHSRFNYNEYLVRIDEVEGRVDGRIVDSKTLGLGFGNNEYTWGFGI